MVQCAVINCFNKSLTVTKANSSVTYHQLPKDSKRKELWVQRLGRPDTWIPTKHTSVCSKHFTPDCFYYTPQNKRRLHVNAVPSLSLPPWIIAKLNINNQSKNKCSDTSLDCGLSVPENSSVLDDDTISVTIKTKNLKNTNTSREKRLENQVKRLQLLAEKNRKTIRCLQQNNRRKERKIQCLKKILNSLVHGQLLNDKETNTLNTIIKM